MQPLVPEIYVLSAMVAPGVFSLPIEAASRGAVLCLTPMMAALRHVGKLAAGAALGGLMARLGLLALGVLVFLAVLVAGVTCWVFGSDVRTERVSRVLLAWRRNASCLASTSATTPGLPVPRPRRWPWLRRPRNRQWDHAGRRVGRESAPAWSAIICEGRPGSRQSRWDRCLARTTPNTRPGRYRPRDALLAFLEGACDYAEPTRAAHGITTVGPNSV